MMRVDACFDNNNAAGTMLNYTSALPSRYVLAFACRSLWYKKEVHRCRCQGRQVLCMGRLNPSFNRLISARRKTFPAAKKRLKVEE